MNPLKIVFLGTSSCMPELENDTASYWLGDEILVDTGWYANKRLRGIGVHPKTVKYICVTHDHHDHSLGLPALLYEHYMAKTTDTLNVYGPSETIKRLVTNALNFINIDYYWPGAAKPRVFELKSEDSFETLGFFCRVCASDHAVPGRCYRITDKKTGVSIGFSGDTKYRKNFKDFFKGCNILIHEYSLGIKSRQENPGKHSSIEDAARAAEEAGVKILCPVHGPQSLIEQCNALASKMYHGTIHWPCPGEQFVITSK
jgi:ribonuclease BN (tRNA processing enzyme)